MTARRQARSARRKLAAHDRGENRHNKALQWMVKRNRLAAERNSARQRSHERQAARKARQAC